MFAAGSCEHGPFVAMQLVRGPTLAEARRSLPAVARKVSSNPESYVYLAESIQAWPAQRAMAQRIAGAGCGACG